MLRFSSIVLVAASWWVGVLVSGSVPPVKSCVPLLISALLLPPLGNIVLLQREPREKKRTCISEFVFGTLFAILILKIARSFTVHHIDDVHPNIPCPMIDTMARRGRVVAWLIPSHNGTPLNNHTDFCEKLRSLPVTFGLHGVNEHHAVISELDEAIGVWKQCTGAEQLTTFAPAGGWLSSLKDYRDLHLVKGLHIRTITDALTSKVYHCDDSFCPFAFMCTTKALEWF